MLLCKDPERLQSYRKSVLRTIGERPQKPLIPFSSSSPEVTAGQTPPCSETRQRRRRCCRRRCRGAAPPTAAHSRPAPTVTTRPPPAAPHAPSFPADPWGSTQAGHPLPERCPERKPPSGMPCAPLPGCLLSLLLLLLPLPTAPAPPAPRGALESRPDWWRREGRRRRRERPPAALRAAPPRRAQLAPPDPAAG